MKKQYLLVVLFLVSFGFQNTYAGGAGGLGIKAGLNFSTIGFENENFGDARNKFRIGGTAGVGYEFATDGFFAFEVEALYALRGQKQTAKSPLGVLTVRDYLHYINFPASLKFYIGDVFNVHVGGYAGVAIGGKTNIDFKTSGLGNDSNESYSLFGEKAQDPQGDDLINRLDAGVHFGAEFVSEKGMGVGARGYIGLTDVTNDEHLLGTGFTRTGEISIYAIFRLGN